MLHHRAGAARADEHPGHARRPARHRDHHRRRPDQRLLPDRPRAQGRQGGGQRRRRRGDRLHRADQGDGRAPRQCHHVRPQGRDLPGPRRARPVEVAPMRSRPTRARWRRRWTAPTSSSACPPPARSSPRWSRTMAPQPIIFAMANPDPEITPPEAKAARPDAIVATGRSDYPNQVNNVLGFPFIFRGALDVRATDDQRGDEDRRRRGARRAGARSRCPRKSPRPMAARRTASAADYIIPAPFDPRLMEVVPAAVAQAAMDSGVAQQADRRHGRLSHSAARSRLNPTTSVLTLAYEAARANPKRVMFAEGEEDVVLRAAIAVPRRRLRHAGAGRPRRRPRPAARARRRRSARASRSTTAATIRACRRWSTILYERLQRRGYLHREVERMVNQDRNIFAALLLALGEADAMITGITRPYRADACARSAACSIPSRGRDAVRHPPDGRPEPHRVHRRHDDQRAADRRAARRHRRSRPPQVARRHGPRAARRLPVLFDLRQSGRAAGSSNIRDAVQLLDERDDVDFEYEGEMAPDVALNPEVHGRSTRSAACPAPANVLVMPGLQIGQHLGQAAARAGRRRGDRADAGRHGEAGADRADDRDRPRTW